MFEIKVYGMDLADVESIGGWQSYLKSSNEDYVGEMYENLVISRGEDNVALYLDGNLIDEMLYTVEDDYASNAPCDTYGACACTTSCPYYHTCMA